jgi:prepilin-type N-terminal cleavage/methylation domain-containing protein
MKRFAFTRLCPSLPWQTAPRLRRSSTLNASRSGFTLIELLLVIGIIGVVGAISIPLYNDFQIRSDLNLATEQASQGLARARILSQSGKGDDNWGFFVPSGTLYKGISYAERDTEYDEVYPMPSTITTTGLLEVSFSRLEGAPSATGTIVLTSLTGEQRTVLMTVEKSGIAMNSTDRITICHVTGDGSPNHTLEVADNAWPGHQSHGDSLGSCPAESSSSSTSETTSSSSSTSSSVSSSSASSASSAGATCTDRISIAADGTLTTTSTVNVTWKALGSAITFGEGGPEVNVYVSYKVGTAGSYTSLFSGRDIDGNETQTVNGIAANSVITTKAQAYYRQKWWLTYDQSYTNSDEEGHTITLRNGDTLPNYPALASQASLETFLQPYVNASRVVTIGQYEVLYLMELGSIDDLTSESVDFQDAVLLLTFNQPAGACN